jgi:Protein of unknown function (DUF559)
MTMMPDSVIAGVTDEGTDAEPDNKSRFLASVWERQPAVWAMLCHGRIVVDDEWVTTNWVEYWDLHRLGIYLPPEHWNWYVDNSSLVNRTMAVALRTVWGSNISFEQAINNIIKVEMIVPIPAYVAQFVAQNTGRPMPRRYNSTAVTFTERDGITWLTPPEVIMYDLLKETNWLFVPQAAFVKGDVRRIPDFLIYWNDRHDQGVIVEVDSDAFHLPSQREPDEARERAFQARGFQFLRFPAKRVLQDPLAVVADIRRFCEQRWGK